MIELRLSVSHLLFFHSFLSVFHLSSLTVPQYISFCQQKVSELFLIHTYLHPFVDVQVSVFHLNCKSIINFCKVKVLYTLFTDVL